MGILLQVRARIKVSSGLVRCFGECARDMKSKWGIRVRYALCGRYMDLYRIRD